MSDEKKKWEIEKLGELTLDELKSIFGYEASELAPFSGKPLARVHTCQNRVQGDFLVGILDQEGIPALHQSTKDTAYDGLFQPQWGFGFVITRQEDAYRAQTIIESVLATIEKEAELAAEQEETDE